MPAGAPPRADDAHVREADAVMSSWRKLPESERRRTLALMSLELQAASDGGDRELALWSEAVYEALRSALGPSDGAAHGPQVVRRLLGAPGAWGPVRDFLELAGCSELRPAERLAVMRMLARLLVARARSVAQHADIPLTAKLVANNAAQIAGIFDAAFPGYLAAGLVRVVARHLLASRGQRPPQDD